MNLSQRQQRQQLMSAKCAYKIDESAESKRAITQRKQKKKGDERCAMCEEEEERRKKRQNSTKKHEKL